MPGLETTEYETIPDDEGWVKVRVASEYLWELITTPTYSTWQGERWQFCCQKPMVYHGEWQNLHKNQSDKNWAELNNQIEQILTTSPYASVYIFKCSECGRYKYHYDFS